MRVNRARRAVRLSGRVYWRRVPAHLGMFPGLEQMAVRRVGCRVVRQRTELRGFGLLRLKPVRARRLARVRIVSREAFRAPHPKRWYCTCCGAMGVPRSKVVPSGCVECYERVFVAGGRQSEVDECWGCCTVYDGPGAVDGLCPNCRAINADEGASMDVNPALNGAVGTDGLAMGLEASLASLLDAHTFHLSTLERLYYSAVSDVERRYYADCTTRQNGIIEGLRVARAIAALFVLPE